MNNDNTKPSAILVPDVEEAGSVENPCAPKAGNGRADVLTTLLALAATESFKLAAELLIKKFTRR